VHGKSTTLKGEGSLSRAPSSPFAGGTFFDTTSSSVGADGGGAVRAKAEEGEARVPLVLVPFPFERVPGEGGRSLIGIMDSVSPPRRR
jgi:hypothetical protein